MKTEEKIRENYKIIFEILFFLIIILCSIIFYNFCFEKNNVYAKETNSKNENIKISQAKPLDIEEILSENLLNGKEEYVIEENELEYITKYKNNNSLPKGMIQVVQEGREGKQQVTKKRLYKNDELISEEKISTKIIKASVNKIVEVGTANYTSNYIPKIGDILYVTSDRLSVMVEPDEKSQKIATLTKGNKIKLLEKNGEWYKIISSETTGYVKSECTTYIDQSDEYKDKNLENSKSKAQLISNLNFNMELNKPSGLTIEQFKKVLTDSKDVNNIFKDNAEYFYYIEKQYNINGIFVASVGIHESSWGTSKICKEKKNLFGYGAYDSNPYNEAYSFSNYSESIDLIARVFIKYYLNPNGTSIYGGDKAIGTYYNGATLSGINKKYATDKNWSNSVYNYMKYLYNKL